MPDVKFYCPEEKSSVIPRFRSKHGKEWGRRIVELMEAETASSGCPTQENTAETIYNRFFGDITNENEFISDFGRESSIAAVKNRLDSVFSRHKDNYPEIVKIVREKMPKISAQGKI